MRHRVFRQLAQSHRADDFFILKGKEAQENELLLLVLVSMSTVSD